MISGMEAEKKVLSLLLIQHMFSVPVCMTIQSSFCQI